MPQYSVCFQSVNGWLWHWAHCSWTPRNSLVVTSVILSTVLFARKKVTAAFASWSPSAVRRSRTILSHGVLSLKFFVSHAVSGSNWTKRLSVLRLTSRFIQTSAMCLP